MSLSIDTANEIFCVYAHQDQRYIEAFRQHLSLLQREGAISSWYDGMIEAGQDRQHDIETHLNRANIILLFVSSDFFADDLCMNIVLPAALQRDSLNESLVITVLVRACDWQASSFAHLLVLPKEGKPIAAWRHRDEAYVEIVKSIRSLISNHRVPPMHCSLLNLPFHRNRLFTGREEILEKMYVALESKKEIALIQAINGLGGIGKTQTAIEYAYSHQDHYALIIWLNSGSRETIFSDVMRLAREINTPNCYNQDQNIVVQGFRSWLEWQHNWLLILDNVEDMTLLHDYMPRGRGHLLITTRRQSVGGAIEGISLDTMNEKIGGVFLLKRAKRIAVDLPLEQIPVDEMQSAMHLSALLGGLPLALDQAGGYIERKQCSIERYLQIYEQAHEHLLAESGFPEDITDYKNTVATTWSLSFQQVASHKYGQAATDLLRLYAFLASDRIPIIGFNTSDEVTLLLGPELGSVVADVFRFEEVLEILLKYSLIRRKDDILFVHRLVQTVIRDSMTEEERTLWMERAVLVVNNIFPSGEHGTWPLCELLLPHALTCVKWIQLLKRQRLEGVQLLNVIGRYLYERAQYDEAKPLLQRALFIAEEQLGASHPDTLTSLNNLATLYLAQGRYREAEPLYQQALLIAEEHLGIVDSDTATSLNNLAQLYEKQGRYGEAEPLYQQALLIAEEQLGATHPQTAGSLNNLAHLYEAQGRYAEAEVFLLRAISIRMEQLGATHPDTAISLNNLATLYRAQGRYREAKPLLQRALFIAEEQLGTTHPQTATSLNNLAEIYKIYGRYAEAEAFLLRAISIRVEQLGATHPQTATSLNNLAGLYQAQGRYGEAEPLYQQALFIAEEQLGATHPQTVGSLNNLARLYEVQRKYVEAEPLYQRALTLIEDQSGANHPDIVTSLNNLAGFYACQKKYAEAEALCKRALAICERGLGRDNTKTKAARKNYDTLLDYMGRVVKETTHFQASDSSSHQREVAHKKAKNKMVKQSRKNNRNR